MTRKLIATLLTLSFAGNIHADVRQSHQCERYGIERTVELVTPEGASVPCQVVYSKPMEDQSSTSLWTAQNDGSYCQQKYDNFIVKLETQLEWSCTARTTLPAKVENLELADARSNNKTDNKTRVLEPTALAELVTEVTTSQNGDAAISTSDVSPMPTTEHETTKTELANRAKPELLAALPTNEIDAAAKQAISLELIRQRFPTGHYKASTQTPHTGDTVLCPADGFYIWNTQRPDQPSFEMGTEAVFIFNLKQFSDPSQASIGGGSRTVQCDIDIRSSYCINGQLQGQSSASREIADEFACREQASNSVIAGHGLALISALTTSSTTKCSTSAPFKSMGLASLPLASTFGRGNTNGEVGMELVVVDQTGLKATCRYARGR